MSTGYSRDEKWIPLRALGFRVMLSYYKTSEAEDRVKDMNCHFGSVHNALADVRSSQWPPYHRPDRISSPTLSVSKKLEAPRHISLCTRPYTLKSLSHVCRIWRRVALGSPRLFTDAIDYAHDHPDFVQELLCRSANVPVVIKAQFPMQSTRGMQNIHLALTESAIDTLDIQGSPEILDQVLRNLDAAFLQTLSLFVPWAQMPKSTPYPGPSFQLNAPRLRTLSLSNFVVSWDATIFSNLTHLRLHLQDQTFAPSMVQILGMLTSSPMLKELNLLHAIEISSRLPSHESLGVVLLCHLTALLLDDEILNHIFLLRHIEIPLHCTLSLKVEHRATHTLIAELGRPISISLPLGELDKIYLEGEPSEVIVRGYTAASPANPLVHITLRCPERYSREAGKTAATMLSSLLLIATTSLEFVFRDPYSTVIPVETWQMCLQNVGAVKSLVIKPAAPRNLLSALSVTVDDGVLLPRLERLEIHRTEPSRAPSNEPDRRKPAGPLGNWWQKIEVTEVTFFDTLLVCLQRRQQLGVEISSLRINRSAPCSEQQMRSLKPTVKDVSWFPH
ncbi:hypothetical protein B0H19DRAFT_506745 [Mycena capillaripes]|nr:hypothetical protein B0H19DRAFT_506745 [Mycena capillaripes]